MELWLDTIDYEYLNNVGSQYVISGVTTNPSILSATTEPALKIIQTLIQIKQSKFNMGKIAVQVTESEYAAIIEQGMRISNIDKHIIVKIPVTEAGLSAIKTLSALQIPTMATAIFEPRQILLAAKAGAMYGAPFLSRIEGDYFEVIKEMVQLIKNYSYSLKILVAAIKSVEQLNKLSLIGVDAVTLRPETFDEYVAVPKQTLERVNDFMADWYVSGKVL